jgi:hypothetical protein
MSVVSGVRTDLAGFELRQAGVSESAFAYAALALAERMDDPETHPTSLANCARALQDILAMIVQSLPPMAERDGLDELNDRRSRRRKSA